MPRRAGVVALVLSLLAALLAAGLTAPGPAAARPTYLPAETVAPASGFGAEVVTTPRGVTLAVWASTTSGTPSLLWSVRRPGRPWTAAATLDADLDPGSPAHDLVLDRAGNVVVAWVRVVPAGASVVTRTYLASRRWSAATVLSPAAQEAAYPSLTLDPAGAITALWSRTDTPDGVLVTRWKPPGRPWRAARPVSGSVAAQESAVATDRAGRQSVLWLQWDGVAPDSDDERVRSASHASGAAAWSRPAYLMPTGQRGTVLDVAPASDGLLAVWRNDSTGQVESRLKRPGRAWAPVRVVGQDPVGVYVDADRRGRVTVVWESPAADDSLLARRYVAGRWSATEQVATAVDTFRTALDVAPGGRAVVQFRTDDLRVWTAYRPATTFGPPRVLGDSPPGQVQADGVHVDEQGNTLNLWNAVGELRATAYDVAGPATRITRLELRRFRRGRLQVHWTSLDRWSQLGGAHVQLRSSRPGGGFGPWRRWPSGFTVDPGAGTATVDKTRRHCVRVRARDVHATWGPWAARCTPRPR